MENRTWQGQLIPPAELTLCGCLTDTPEKFYVSACEEVDRLLRDMGLTESSRILDIGCGVGRLAIGLLARQAAFHAYVGVDVSQIRVDWCVKDLAATDDRLSFHFIDMPNARYNPRGQSGLDLSFPAESFEIVYLYSIFSHLIETDVKNYLDLISAVLTSQGVCFTTMFVADGVQAVTENPSGFGPLKWSGPLHCMLYNRAHWHAMVDAAGLKIIHEIPEVNVDGQTGYLLAKADVPSRRAPDAAKQSAVPVPIRTVFLGFFGLNRSLQWTFDSIKTNIFDRTPYLQVQTSARRPLELSGVRLQPAQRRNKHSARNEKSGCFET